MAYKLTAANVSRVLAAAGHTRSKEEFVARRCYPKRTEGFYVRTQNGPGRFAVVVSWADGLAMCEHSPTWEDDCMQALSGYADTLREHGWHVSEGGFNLYVFEQKLE